MTRHCTFAAFLVAGTCLFDGAQAFTIETDSETNVTTLNTSADELVTLTAEHVAQFGAGVPTIRRGAVKVNSFVWTLREGDLKGGVPLTIGSDASLTFPAGDVTVTATGDDLAFLVGMTRSVKYPILTVEEGAAFPENTFKLSDAVKAAKWRVKREADTLYLDHTFGLVIVR